MERIREALEDKKNEYGDLKAPSGFEDIIREKLKESRYKSKRLSILRIASILVMIVVISYNSSTLAFYGRTLMGYENVMNDTLMGLSQLGEGQVIDKEVIFPDGVRLRLDMIMLDGNGVVIFYSIYDPTNKVDVENVNISTSIKGLFYNPGYGGHGEYIQDENTQKWVIISSDSPNFFNQKLTIGLNYHNNSTYYYEELSFKLDRSQAVGRTIKFNVNKNIELFGRNILIDKISASSVSTILRGSLQNIGSLAVDIFKGDRVFYDELEMSLFADGVEIDRLGAGISTNLKGTNFSVRFDAIPEDTKEIWVVLNSLNLRKTLDIEEKLELGEVNIFNLDDQELIIEEIKQIDGQTHIIIQTKENIRIPGLSLMIDGKNFNLEDTIRTEVFIDSQGELVKRRTLVFNGIGNEYRLRVKELIFESIYEKEVYRKKN